MTSVTRDDGVTMPKLTPGVAVVTGVAGGIGSVIAHRLAEHGTTVVGLDHDAALLRTVVKDLAEDGLNVHGKACDVTDADAVESIAEEIEADLAPIGSLVNTAAVLRTGSILNYSDDDWAHTFAVNTTGVFHCCRAIARRMATRNRGAIVTVASNSARVPRMRMAAYGASKAASTYLTTTLGLELAEYGIRCNVVHPGSTDSPMLRALWEAEGGDITGSLGGVPAAYRVGIPLRRLGTPDDVADAVAFLLSDKARHITLHELTVDGGAALGA